MLITEPAIKIDKINMTLHEIKNPLTTIISNIQYIILENHLKYKDLKRIKAIENEALRIKNLVMNYSNTSARNKYINVNKVIDGIIYIFKPQLIENMIFLNKQLCESKIFFWGDEYKLKQVIVNLLKNAISACAYKDKGKIAISTAIIKKKIQIKIKDNGCGITKKDLPLIFTPFFTRKLSTEGNGLGLFITSEIIKDFKGEIKVKSKPNGGSTFLIKLPGTR
ncbi:HAMP domain-containing histidine kinase [Candidatus Desantisbacteria bacterium]|nr:HAMP domain-containing histidine kinase [Candidatus Desantisbacteria bacterium]